MGQSDADSMDCLFCKEKCSYSTKTVAISLLFTVRNHHAMCFFLTTIRI